MNYHFFLFQCFASNKKFKQFKISYISRLDPRLPLDKKGIKRVPVLDKENKLAGIVSRADILRILCEGEAKEEKAFA